MNVIIRNESGWVGYVMLKSEAETALHHRFDAVRMFGKFTIKWSVVVVCIHASCCGGPGFVSEAEHINEGFV
jgi:hypothetical protein